MDNPPRDKEVRFRDLRPLPRRFPCGLPVRNIGYFAAKRIWVRKHFGWLSYSFILQGDGEYRRDGRTWAVRSPCVLMAPLGAYVEHGPKKEWEELYFNYLPEHVPAAEARGLVPTSEPVWSIHDGRRFRRRVLELLDSLDDLDSPGQADRIDRLAEGLIMESLIDSATPPLGERDRAVQAVRAYLEQHFREPVDPDELALEHGLSPSDFRRRWSAMMGMPPGRFLNQLRIGEACRLLIETDKRVGEVARLVGFTDQLYFARRFRQLTGETASEYRSQR
jgi:AraC-like DNA-binding protein